MPLTAEERYERLQQKLLETRKKFQETKNKLEKVDAARNEKARKRDLKLMIIFGAAVVNQAQKSQRSDAGSRVLLRSVGAELTRQSDKAAFDSWLKDNPWLLEDEPK